eukprot:Selendium_serpulae@DN4776_c0_g1_i14.p1
MITLQPGRDDLKDSPSGGLSFVDTTTATSQQQTTGPPPVAAGPMSGAAFDQPSDTPIALPSFLRTARHPGVCISHLMFKMGALLTFIFGSFVFGGWKGDYVFTFVVTTIFLSLDFWTVKNVTGRILVGMRWWNDIKEDGSSTWMYESLPDAEAARLNPTDKNVFWLATYAWPFCWIIFLIIYIFRLDMETCLLVVMGLVLSSANLVGYWRCSKDQKQRVTSWASTQAVRAVVQNMTV